MESVIKTYDISREYIEYPSFFKRIRGEGSRIIVAVDNLNISVHRGELFGFLGPNGAGKTTTIKMLSTLLLPTKGTATILGNDILKAPNEVRKRISVVFGGERGLYWRLSGRDNMRIFAELYGLDSSERMDRIDMLLELVGIADRADSKVETYSKGMKQRLHLARGLVHDPDILFLDEPTLGLDPTIAHELRKTIRNLCTREKKTVFLTTHYMFEADELCDRVAIIHRGTLIANDTPENLKRQFGTVTPVTILLRGVVPQVEHVLTSRKGVHYVESGIQDNTTKLKVGLDQDKVCVEDIVSLLEKTHEIISVEQGSPTLEDVFLELTRS
ncbi:MAG: ATP-binding cassette domain-containing protein [Theionarchaea archaeon]|nr:ATP-binding cassette domain-containing protein [Theionarchaea archaeon]MBU7038823.1 ATP-binding cassette domain-containing protein [Theionarchaea archaeon]